MGYSRVSSQSLLRTFKYSDVHGFGRRRFDLFAISSIRRILTGLAVCEVQKPLLIAGEFFQLECPADQVRGWPDELLRFLGYRMFGDSLGVYRDSEDSLAAVYPEREFKRGWVVTPEGEKLGGT